MLSDLDLLCPEIHPNSFTQQQNLDKSKLKAIGDNKIDVTENLKFDLKLVENIVGQGENAGYLHFLLFP